MDLMNPVEWFAWIYGKWFQSHVYMGGAVVVFGFAFLGLILWVRGVDKYREEHPKAEQGSGQVSPSGTPPIPTPIVPKSIKSHATSNPSSGGPRHAKAPSSATGKNVEGKSDCKGSGIRIHDSGSVTIEGTKVYNNACEGFDINSPGKVTITNSEAYDNGKGAQPPKGDSQH